LIVNLDPKTDALTVWASTRLFTTALFTTALENGAQLKDVQKAAGQRAPSSTKLYNLAGATRRKRRRSLRRIGGDEKGRFVKC
jgi:hypothetical protein